MEIKQLAAGERYEIPLIIPPETAHRYASGVLVTGPAREQLAQLVFYQEILIPASQFGAVHEDRPGMIRLSLEPKIGPPTYVREAVARLSMSVDTLSSVIELLTRYRDRVMKEAAERDGPAEIAAPNEP